MQRNYSDIRERMAGLVTFCESMQGYDHAVNARREMFGFLSIMHPELSLQQRLELANDAYRQAGGKENDWGGEE